MGSSLTIIRILFVILVSISSYLVYYTVPEWDQYRWISIPVGLSLGLLVVLFDVLLKGFSLRALSALTFGLFVGTLCASFISHSPLFENGDPQTLFLARLILFVVSTYLCAVIALRGKDEFNLVIPYVRFVPQQVDVPIAVLDSSILIDGRIAAIYKTKFMAFSLVIPSFVLKELQQIADSKDSLKQARGRKGLETLNELRHMDQVDLRIHESELESSDDADAKLVFLAKSLKAKLLSMDYNLSQLADFHGVEWLNMVQLVKALSRDPIAGDQIKIELVKAGKEPGQAVGYLSDGSMVVVNNAKQDIGKSVKVEIIGMLPTGGGKMVFGALLDSKGQVIKNSKNPFESEND